MKAFISDIHANLEALCAVFSDIEQQQVDEIICLGDIVGYGADPEACVDMVMQRADKTVVGNHDDALMNGPVGFNPIAADIIRLTHDRMEPLVEETAPDCFEPRFYPCAHEQKDPPCLIMEHSEQYRWDFLKELEKKIYDTSLLYVHASPLQPIHEYVFPDKFVSSWKPHRIEELLQHVDWLAFCGHTHHPCAISSTLSCRYPEGAAFTLTLNQEEKYIINIGSVGQPRDNDNRACYMLFDEENRAVTWRRVAYDIATAAGKIEGMCGKGNWCAYRLTLGK